MPIMDGFEATKRNLKHHDVIIVALSANSMGWNESKYINAGFKKYLAKPITKGKLNKCIVELFNQNSDSPVEIIDKV